MNRIGSVVELKIYIKVQEEDIRVQEEFVKDASAMQKSKKKHNFIFFL